MRESDLVCLPILLNQPSYPHHIALSCPSYHFIFLYYTFFVDVKKDKNGSDDGSEDPPASPVKPVKGATKQTWGSKPKGTVGRGRTHARGHMHILTLTILTHAFIVLSLYLPFLTILIFFISSLCFEELLFALI